MSNEDNLANLAGRLDEINSSPDRQHESPSTEGTVSNSDGRLITLDEHDLLKK